MVDCRPCSRAHAAATNAMLCPLEVLSASPLQPCSTASGNKSRLLNPRRARPAFASPPRASQLFQRMSQLVGCTKYAKRRKPTYRSTRISPSTPVFASTHMRFIAIHAQLLRLCSVAPHRSIDCHGTMHISLHVSAQQFDFNPAEIPPLHCVRQLAIEIVLRVRNPPTLERLQGLAGPFGKIGIRYRDRHRLLVKSKSQFSRRIADRIINGRIEESHTQCLGQRRYSPFFQIYPIVQTQPQFQRVSRLSARLSQIVRHLGAEFSQYRVPFSCERL